MKRKKFHPFRAFLFRKSTNPDLDLAHTGLAALKESADAFPPLKSAVGGVLALIIIAERAKYCKAEATDVALEAYHIIDILYENIVDPSQLHPKLAQALADFESSLCEISKHLEPLSRQSAWKRLPHLNKDERTIRSFTSDLQKYKNRFMIGSTIRTEQAMYVLEAAMPRKSQEPEVAVLRAVNVVVRVVVLQTVIIILPSSV